MALRSMSGFSRKERTSHTTEKLLISNQKNRDNAMVVFYIGSKLCEKANIRPSDKLDVLWDDTTGAGAIVQTEEGKTVTILKNGRGVLNFTWKEGMPIPPESNGPVEAINVQVEEQNEEIHFTFPENCLQ